MNLLQMRNWPSLHVLSKHEHWFKEMWELVIGGRANYVRIWFWTPNTTVFHFPFLKNLLIYFCLFIIWTQMLLFKVQKLLIRIHLWLLYTNIDMNNTVYGVICFNFKDILQFFGITQDKNVVRKWGGGQNVFHMTVNFTSSQKQVNYRLYDLNDITWYPVTIQNP